MAKREPLGKDPLEWIKRTKPADEEEQQDQAQAESEAPQAAPQPPPEEPGPTPAETPAEEAGGWLDAEAAEKEAAESAPAPAVGPTPSEGAPAAEEAEAVPTAPAEPGETVQATPEEGGVIEVHAPEPPATDWPAAVVQEIGAEADLGEETAEPSEEEEPTQIVGAESEEEEVTAAKLMAEKSYVHVGSTDDEVDTLPKRDSDEYAAVPFPGRQESSLLYPVIMIVCVILMGLLVSFWAEGRLRRLEQRIEKIEKALKIRPSESVRRVQ